MKSIGILYKCHIGVNPCDRCDLNVNQSSDPQKESDGSEKESDGSEKESDKLEKIYFHQLHVNLWDTDQGNFSFFNKPYLAIDFGLEFDPSICEIMILLPFLADKNDFTDLVSILKDDIDLLGTVFNDNLAIKSHSNKNYHTITSSNNTFSMYELSNSNLSFIQNEEECNSTILKINILISKDDIGLDVEKIYIRFRLKLNSLDFFSARKGWRQDFTQALFITTRLFDIRINDKREMNKKTVEKSKSESFDFAKFEKVHFFYMANINDTLESGSNPKVLDSRLLEKYRWRDYLGKEAVFKKDVISYHWKFENRKVDNAINVFFRNQESSFSLKHWLGYFVVIILLAIISSVVSLLIGNICK